MKKLSLFVMLFSCLLIQAQSTTSNKKTLDEINTLLNKFTNEQDLGSLMTAEEKVNNLFQNKQPNNDLQALLVKSDVYHAILEHAEPDEPLKYSDALKSTYRMALEADANMIQRQNILAKVYKTKNLLITKGNETYVASDYSKAHDFFDHALAMNTIERDFPRHMTLDTSVLFSKAIFAKLSDKDKVAITDLERLVEMNYQRSDLYDSLIELYGKEGDDKNIERIQKLKSERFPEE